MDIELKQHLEAMEGRINQGVTTAIKESEKRVVTLITDVKESLEREMNTGFEDMAGRFDAQSNRLDRQAALIQTGSRWTNRMNDWADNVDQALDRKSQEIADLHKRIDKIEGGQK